MPDWCPPLVDLNTPEAIYRWYKLIFEGMDLTPVLCGESARGECPEWAHDEEAQELDFETFSYGHHGGQRFPEQWLQWALRQGISPGTPFLVQIQEPTNYGSVYDGYEDGYDVTFDMEVVRVLPRSPAQSLKAWSRLLTKVTEVRDAVCKTRKDLKALQCRDVEALYLRLDVYSTRYSEPGRGISLQLWSDHPKNYWQSLRGQRLAEGRSDDGDYTEALRNLLNVCKEFYPSIDSLSIVQAQKRGFYREFHLSRFDKINLGLPELG